MKSSHVRTDLTVERSNEKERQKYVVLVTETGDGPRIEQIHKDTPPAYWFVTTEPRVWESENYRFIRLYGREKPDGICVIRELFVDTGCPQYYWEVVDDEGLEQTK